MPPTHLAGTYSPPLWTPGATPWTSVYSVAVLAASAAPLVRLYSVFAEPSPVSLRRRRTTVKPLSASFGRVTTGIFSFPAKETTR